MTALGPILFSFLALQISLNLMSTMLVVSRRRAPCRLRTVTEPMSFVVIIAGLPEQEVRPALSALALADVGHEVIFCTDGRLPPPDELAAAGARARLLVQHTASSANPKVEMMAAGIAAARHDFVVCLDGNTVLPPDLDARIAAAVRGEPFIVSTAPLATDGRGLWGGMEEALISRVYGRWCIAAAALGVPVVFGKLLAFRKSWLAEAGGLDRLFDAAAEDTALARMGKATGARLGHVWPPLASSLVGRTRQTALDRAGRWMQIRRRDVPLVYLAEGALSFGGLVLSGAASAAVIGWSVWPTLAALAAGWHLLEAMLARSMPGGWRPRVHSDALVRDLVFPVLWVRNLFPARYAWRASRP